jgi:hypothetical protein
LNKILWLGGMGLDTQTKVTRDFENKYTITIGMMETTMTFESLVRLYTMIGIFLMKKKGKY